MGAWHAALNMHLAHMLLQHCSIVRTWTKYLHRQSGHMKKSCCYTSCLIAMAITWCSLQHIMSAGQTV